MDKPKKKRILSYVLLIILPLLLVDQITKIILLNQPNKIVLIQDVLEFQKVANTGGAFGVGQNNTITFIITNIVVLGLIIRFIWLQKERMDTKTLVILLIILAGGFGNSIDRIFRGYVVDFIRIFPSSHFPVFNIADICITLGWVSLAFVFAQYTYQEIKNNKGSRG